MRSRFVVSLGLSLFLGWATLLLPGAAAYAQDACTAGYAHEQWRTEMDKVDAAFQQFDLNKARVEIDAVWRHVGCLDAVARPGHLARFARQRALLHFFDQDEETATRWGLLARYTAADFPWSADFAEDHPFRSMVSGASDLPIGGPENAGFKANKKTPYIFLNGRWITEPRARAEIPNLMQFTDKKGLVTSTFWQDGAAFPEDILGPPLTPPAAPKWFVERTTYEDAGGANVFAADRPNEPPPAVAPEPVKSDPTPPNDVGGTISEPETPVPNADVNETRVAPEPEAVATAPAPKPTESPKPTETIAATAETASEKPLLAPPPSVSLPTTVAEKFAAVSPQPVPSSTKASVPQPSASRTIPRLAVGGGLGLVAIVLGVVSNSAANQFYDVSTEANDLVGLRGRANKLLLGAGLAGTAALGVGVTAFISQDGPGLGVSARW